MSKNVLLIDVQTVKDRSAVHRNMDDTLILHEIKVAQDQSITPALGTNLLERLQAGVEAADLTADEVTLIDIYITDALVQFTLAGMVMGSSFQFFTKGMLRRTSENTELPSESDMVNIAMRYKDRGEFYRDRLIWYLRTNKASFPTYRDQSCTDDITPVKSGYTVPMWLDDTDDCTC